MDNQIIRVCFWVCALCIGLASSVGMASIWIDDMWVRYSFAWKLNQTAGLFGVTAVGVAIMVWAFNRWLLNG